MEPIRSLVAGGLWLTLAVALVGCGGDPWAGRWGDPSGKRQLEIGGEGSFVETDADYSQFPGGLTAKFDGMVSFADGLMVLEGVDGLYPSIWQRLTEPYFASEYQLALGVLRRSAAGQAVAGTWTTELHVALWERDVVSGQMGAALPDGNERTVSLRLEDGGGVERTTTWRESVGAEGPSMGTQVQRGRWAQPNPSTVMIVWDLDAGAPTGQERSREFYRLLGADRLALVDEIYVRLP